MPASHSTNARAACYYRMSTLRQEDSVERQQSQVVPYAERAGYALVGSPYIDEGIAGNEIERRPAFQRLLRDAQRGLFDVILCDDKDRFGRFDSLELGEIAGPLRRKGVRLETVAQGRIDWNSFAGRITDAVLQEAKKMESQAISRRVLTQMLLKARQGEWVNAMAPYGYRVSKEGGRRHLVIGDPHEVEVVRWMFDKVANHGWTIGDVHRELRARAVAPPRGNGYGKNKAVGIWNRSTVRNLLVNRAYVGDVTYNRLRQGKYHEHVGGRVEAHDAALRRNRASDESDWIVCENTHPPLVDRDTFRRAREALARNQSRTNPKRRGDGRYLLTRLLVCGHCGSHLVGKPQEGYRTYRCGTSARLGPAACTFKRVREDVVLPLILAAVRGQFLNPERLAELREEIRRQDEEAMRPDGEANRLRRRLAELDAQVARANVNITLLTPDLVPGVAEVIRTLKVEREQAARELARLESGKRRQDLEELVKAAEAQLWRLRDAEASADQEELRDALSQIIDRVELHFGEVPHGKRVRRPLTRGVIYLRQEDNLTTCSRRTAGP